MSCPRILRAAGYHSARTSVLDALTDLAARYFFHLCQLTALYASHNHPPSALPPPPSIADVRMALQRAGALLPERVEEEQAFFGAEDMRGTEEFLAWAAGPVNREIKRVALGGRMRGGIIWMVTLKKKHSKNDDDGSKFTGTLLGRGNEHGEVQVEGGEVPSIDSWEERLQAGAERRVEEVVEEEEEEERPLSSGLSSLSGGSLLGDEMEM
ncbi:hypothetical protein B0T18DRAFT_442420 [Schizothecium vesticola]|uniref:Bromodomain associated domain-containing protein n=1 Tax=Schizothecium vesticola TaxID=314040 RepID=A0AA40KC99_9PEZI|nr:hypothetical protein B0T18DRAFT_442420 [Schizothecium vesticola]